MAQTGRTRSQSMPAGQDGLRPRNMTFRFSNLLISMVLLVVGLPLFGKTRFATLAAAVFGSLLLALAAWSVSVTRRQTIGTLLIAVPALSVRWCTMLVEGIEIGIADQALWVVFYAYCTIMILLYVLRAPRVSGDILCGGVCVYLLMGLAWSAAYRLIEMVQPGSFALAGGSVESGGSDLLFFSFATLTTVGYGDITPTADVARSLALLEGVTGVLYVAMLVARLVSIYIRQTHQESERHRD